MSTAPDGREVIPAGEQPEPGYKHLLPVAKFLVEERGHLPLEKPERYGWSMGLCELTRSITAEDWAAVNERFVLPDSIFFFCDYIIRDGVNRVDIIGYDTFEGIDGVQSIEVWEARIRERDAGRQAETS